MPDFEWSVTMFWTPAGQMCPVCHDLIDEEVDNGPGWWWCVRCDMVLPEGSPPNA